MERLTAKLSILVLVLMCFVLPSSVLAAFTDCAISWDSFANNPGFIAAYTYEGTPIKDTESDGTGGDDTHGNANVPPSSTDLASAVDGTSNPGAETAPFFGYYNGGTTYDPDDPSTMEDDVLFFRMRLRGDPSAKASFASYHWNILLDVDGDGYKEYWVDLEGSYQQSSNTDPDRLNILYDNSNRQDIADPDLARVESFAALNTTTTTASCPTAGESHTRAMAVSTLDPTDTSGDWVIEFQIPMTAFNDGQGNQVVYPDSPVSFVFSTGASNQDPLQKDWMMDLDFLTSADPITFGDVVYPNGKPVIEFIDANMDSVDYYSTGDDIYLWVNDRLANSDSATAETITVTVTDPATGDDEVVTLTETGPDTGIFTNNVTGGDTLSSSTTSGTDDDGDLETADGNQIYVSYTNSNGTTVTDEATMLGVCDVLIAFTRANGLETDDFQITDDTSTSDVLYVTVTHSGANVDTAIREEINIVLTDPDPDSSETVTLTLRETGLDTGIFRNYDSSATSDDGLPTEIAVAPIDTTDFLWEAVDAGQVTATYEYSCGGSNLTVLSTATLFATASGGRVSFTNSAGTYDVDTYSTGDPIYVKVVDTTVGIACHSTTGQVTVVVSSPTTGDSITLTLVETFSGSGIYINSTTSPSSVPTASTYDGSIDTTDAILEAIDDEQLTVNYVDCEDGDNDSTNNTKSDTATYNAPSIVIQEVLYYPDSTTCQTEHVKLINNSGSSVDVTGYEISDGDGFSYTIPQYQGVNLTLAPGDIAYISIYPTTTTPVAFDDGGSPTTYYLYAQTGTTYPSDVLEDSGGSDTYDQVLLYDSGGTVIDYVGWSGSSTTSIDFRGDDSLAVLADIWTDDSYVDVSAMTVGQSLGRTSSGYDTNTIDDWQLNAASTSVCSVATTVVTLGRFESLMQDGQVIVRWETTSEHDTVGFHLERREGPTYRRVNTEMLPGLITSPTGGVYTLVDPAVSQGDQVVYRLVEVEASGRQNFYGPFRVVAGGETAPARIEPLAELGRQIVLTGQDTFRRQIRQLSVSTAARWQRRFDAAERSRGFFRQMRALRSGEQVKIPIRRDGLYSIDSERLGQLLGLPQPRVEVLLQSHNLSLESQGRPIGYEVVREGSRIRNATPSKLLFYGQAAGSLYTDENVYWLRIGRDRSRGWDGLGRVLEWAGRRPEMSQSYFIDQAVSEQDQVPVFNIASDPGRDFWMWDYLFAGYAGLEQKDFTVELENVAAVNQETSLDIGLFGASGAARGPDDHHLIVILNGEVVGETRWKGINYHQAKFPIRQQQLLEGENTVTLRAVKDAGVPYSVFYLDKVAIGYARPYEAIDNSLLASAGNNGVVTVTGFTSSDLIAFEVEDQQSEPLRRRVESLVGGDYAASFLTRSPRMKYFVGSAGGAAEIDDAYVANGVDLRNQSGAEWLIVAPGSMLAAARELADYRAAQGLGTLVVDIEDIYDTFSYGLRSPEAVKEFVRYAGRYWDTKPRYVVLAGEGSVDYRGLLGHGDSLVPPLLAAAERSLFVADSLLGDVEGDSAPEIAVGRLPVLTNEELLTVVEKIKRYEKSIGGKALMVADNADKAGDFPLGSSILELLAQESYQSEWLTIGEQPAATVRSELIAGINAGAKFISYIGHGSMFQLASEKILTKDDVPGLTNTEQPGFISALTCNLNNFAHPGFDSLGEELVVSRDGGAAAVWSSSTLNKNNVGMFLARNLYETVFNGSTERLGDGLVKAFRAQALVNNGNSTLGMYSLLGDPALKIK